MNDLIQKIINRINDNYEKPTEEDILKLTRTLKYLSIGGLTSIVIFRPAYSPLIFFDIMTCGFIYVCSKFYELEKEAEKRNVIKKQNKEDNIEEEIKTEKRNHKIKESVKNDVKQKTGIELEQQLYSDFINNICEKIKELGINDPIEIYSFYKFFCKKMFLTNNCLVADDTKYKNQYGLIGAANLSNSKSCFAKNGMLCDILNDCGIEAYQVGCHLGDYELVENNKEENEYERTHNWITRNIIDKKISDELYENLENSIEDPGYFFNNFEYKRIDNNTEKNDEMNHSIVYAKYNGIGYYIDPSTSKIYTNDGKEISSEEYGKLELLPNCGHYLNYNVSDEKQINEFNNLKISANIEKLNETFDKTYSLCRTNDKLFDTFYSENRDLRRDIESKVKHL